MGRDGNGEISLWATWDQGGRILSQQGGFQVSRGAYSRRGIYNQREKYNQWPFRGLFSYVKNFFSTFFFLRLKLRTICYKKQEKKVQKKFVLEGKN